MTIQRLTFLGASGARRTAWLDVPGTGPAHAYALFAHCLSCGKNRTAAATISSALNDAGIAVLRYDFTGLGESEADAADISTPSDAGALVAAATFLAESYAPPALLVGHSLGGAAVLQAAAHIPSACAVATIGAPSTPGSVTRLLLFESIAADIRTDPHIMTAKLFGGSGLRVGKAAQAQKPVSPCRVALTEAHGSGSPEMASSLGRRALPGRENRTLPPLCQRSDAQRRLA
jgi:pimeloyl-ACP methyl ester carboxylesterase